MNSLIASEQVTRIVHELCQLRGSSSVRVVARNFPRFGPADTGTGYQEDEYVLQSGDAQNGITLKVRPNADEIAITLRGDLVEPSDADDLLERVNAFFDDSGIGSRWEVRAHFGGRGPSASTYRFDVFTCTPGTPGTPSPA